MIPSRLLSRSSRSDRQQAEEGGGGWIEASPPDIEFEGGTDGYYDSIFDGPGWWARTSVVSAVSGNSRSGSGGDNQYEDSLFEKTGYSSSTEVAGEEDQDESVIGKFMI
jgi:hypothetical protein